ncbi:AlpA family transcriptional regulator [Croceicoccus sp. Ery15]|uniref:helix-turn-helix transcriptional regulator n=1 Tax=Croceicoccus sp. Ery15 TaxID=1703338 RepID=UPI001E396FAC|nr:AlpA family phage regulatory protein [Croceicoccus sp. Ery15]
MQPAEPDGLVSMKTLMALISVNSRATVYKYIEEVPDFPQPCKFGVRRGRVRFKASDVNRYIESLPTRPKRRK